MKRSFRLITKRSDSVITVVLIALIGFGSLMVLSTDVGQTTTYSGILWATLRRQVIIALISFLLYGLASRLYSPARFRYVIGMLALIWIGVMVLPFAFSQAGGSHAWIRLGGFTLQPSEFVKVLMILLSVHQLFVKREKKKGLSSLSATFRMSHVFYLAFAIETILQKDTGTFVIISAIYVMCLLIPAYPSFRYGQRRIWLTLVSLTTAMVVLFGVTNIGNQLLAKTPFAHIVARIENMKNPYLDVYQEGYQPANALYGIGSSKVIGKGLGNSSRKFGYLTQADNDYILAVIVEELGIFGLGFIVVMYGILFWRLLHYALATNEVMDKVILMGTITYLFMHFTLNVGGVAALIPFTGVPLLFISSGGSSLMAICLMMGICQARIAQIKQRELVE